MSIALKERLICQPRLLVPVLGCALALFTTAVPAQSAPEPNPPVRAPVVQPENHKTVMPEIARMAPTAEWVLHKSGDGADPDGREQKMIWMMNRARSDPTAEGIWLAESDDPDVAGGRNFFNVGIQALKDAFAALPPAPPAAFDIRLHDASELHSLDLIARDAQDHNGQFDRINASGFNCNGGRVSVFSFADSALNAHAALNIDWGNGPDGMQDPPGHRLAIMGVVPFAGMIGLTNVGLAMVEENVAMTQVGPLVFSGGYCQAGNPDFNRFIVGTVWDDLDEDGDYDEDEGLGGVLVMPDNGTYYAITGDAGGYAIPIEASGSYSVTFSGGDLGAGESTMQVSIGADSVLLDLKAGTDTDGDGIGDNADPDDDNDGVLDAQDAWPLGRFDDVDPATHFAFFFVETLERSGVTGGCGGNSYCPDDSVTRAQMAVFLERGINGNGFVPPPATGTIFGDIGATDFGAAFIERLFADGITGGCGGGNYCPTNPVTRAQMSVFLLRAKHGSGYTPPPATGVFNDVPIGAFADAWIEQLAAEGITGGCGGGNYCPSDPVTRAQMAVFLVKAFEL